MLSWASSAPTVPFAFVVLKDAPSLDQTKVIEELRALVASKIAKYAVPDHFLVSAPWQHDASHESRDATEPGPKELHPGQVVRRLPKTRSGKIMRRILRKIAMGQADNLGDVSTLEDPSVVAEIVQAYKGSQRTSSDGH